MIGAIMPIRLFRRLSSVLPVGFGRYLLFSLSVLLGGSLTNAQGGIALIQHRSKDAGTTTSASLAFNSNNTAGNWIGICIRAGRSGQLFSVTDSRGNTYRPAVQFNVTVDTPNGDTLGIFYAENVAGGANTVTVSDTVSGTLRFAILEYSGVALANSLETTAVAQGNSASPSTMNTTTLANGDLLLGAIMTGSPATFTAGSGFTIEESVPGVPNTKLIAEDQIQTTAGTISAGASLGFQDKWGASLAAFKPATGGGTGTNIAATAGTPQSATISTAFATPFQATVKDSGNNPVNGATVTFMAPASGASGAFAGGVNTATTNAQGVATATTFTANGTAGGPYSVTASVSGAATPASFSLTNLAGAPASITVTAGTPQSATVGTAFATRLQATVNDSGNNPVSGATVTFAAPTSGTSGTFAGGMNTATTNTQGVATAATFTANSTAGGPYNVSASVTGVATPANFSLTNLPVSTGGVTLVQHVSKDAGSTTSSSLAFNSNNTAGNWIGVCIRAGKSGQLFSVTDSRGNAYHQAIQFNVTIDPPGGDTLGIFYAENVAGGANTVTVSDTVSGTLRFAILEYSGVALANSLETTAVAQGNSASPSTMNTTTLANGDLLLGAIMTGSPATFTAGSGFTIEESVPGVPNTKLIAEDQIQTTAGTISAGASLGFQDKWGASLAAFKPATGGGTGINIAATAGTPQSATISTAFATPFQATVKDSGNNPVNGATVTFMAPASGASGAFAGGVNTATTNAQGVATATTFTANGTAGGPYSVTASVSGAATPASFSLTNLAGAPASITVTAGTPQSATVGTAFATRLQATVNDSGNNPVSGATVTFAAPASGASGTFAGGMNTATTNTQGVATAATFTANSTAGGPYNVSASVTGVATPANFSLTNLPVSTGGVTLVQHVSKDAGSTTSSSLAFNSNNTAGNWIGVCIRAGKSGQLFSVTDSRGNAYHQAIQFNVTIDPPGGDTLGIFYAENVAGGANTVTVSDTVSGTLRFAILEYSGVALANSLETTAVAQGNSASPSTMNTTTLANGDLLLGAIMTGSPATFTAGSGFTIEESVPGVPNTKLIAEDQIQTTAGTISAGASLGAPDAWGAGLAAFRSANSGPPPPISVSVSPTTASVPTGSGTQG